MQTRRLLFLGRHELLDPFIDTSTQNSEVAVFQNAMVEAPVDTAVTYTPVNYGLLSFSRALKFFGIGITVPTYIIDFRKTVAEVHPDIIITFDYFLFSTWQALYYKRKNPDTKIYIYSETKSWPKNAFTRAVMKLFFWRFKKNIQYVDTILVWTEQGKRWFAENLPEKEVVLVPAPVDTDFFVPKPQKNFLEDGKLKVLCNARYASYKRHEDLFQAILELKTQGRKIHMFCIGRADSGKEKMKLRVRELGLQSEITFLDTVSKEEMPAVYQMHDVLVLPSYNEAIGMAVPEAMACGIPTITSDTVGANVYVQEDVTGFVYSTGAVPQLVDSLKKCFDTQKLSVMGTNARRHMTERHTLEAGSVRFAKALKI